MRIEEKFGPFLFATVAKYHLQLQSYTQDELMAECQMAITQAIERWNGEQGRLESWIFTYVVGRMRDLSKKAKKTRTESLEVITEAELVRNNHFVEF